MRIKFALLSIAVRTMRHTSPYQVTGSGVSSDLWSSFIFAPCHRLAIALVDTRLGSINLRWTLMQVCRSN